MKWVAILMVLALTTLVGLRVWRFADDRSLRQHWETLQRTAPTGSASRFRPEMVADLPAPVQRYFRAVIEPETVLRTVAQINMHGQISLGTKASHSYKPMRACQLLAAPDGFIWYVQIGEGLPHLIGSDAAFPNGSWTRFWLGGIIPVARTGNDADHQRSSFGRYIAEAVFWTPAALLPSDSVQWDAHGANDVSVTVSHRGQSQTVNLRLNDQGLPVQVRFKRWSDANPAGEYQWQSFGGDLSEFKSFDGFTVPTRVDAGNFFGGQDYFPFYQATVDTVRFLESKASEPTICNLTIPNN